jgi:adenylate cyclase
MRKSFLIIIIALVIIFVRFLFASVFEQMELTSYDLRARMSIDNVKSKASGVSKHFAGNFKGLDRKNIVIIEIDDASRNELSKDPSLDLGPWPWRRDVWSKVIKFVEKGEPKAVLFDLIFADNAEANSYQDIKLSWRLRNYDNIVLSTSLNRPKDLVDKLGTKDDEIKNSDFLPTSEPLNVIVEGKKVDKNITFLSHAPINDIYTEYIPTAVLNTVESKDNILRQHRPLFKLVKDGETYYMPSLAFAGFMKAVGDDGQITLRDDKIIYKNRVIPIDENGAMNVSWHGANHNYEFMPIYKLLIESERDKIDPDYFKDKIVLIGRTEAGTDVHSTSVHPAYLGTEYVATALDNMLNDTDPENLLARKFITTIPVYVEYGLIVIFCALIVTIGMICKNPFYGLINGALILILYILLCIFVFMAPSLRLWVPMAVPLYYMLVTAAIFYTYRLHKESSKKTEIMNIFGKFVSPSVLSTLLADSKNLVLKNSKKRITVLFCDVKDFTTISEKSNPAQLVENLNELFNEIVDIVFKNNGTVDKFVGDCVMAYWGDPIASENDAFMAVKTALEIKKKIGEMRISNIKEGKIVFDVNIGINTGDALLGLIGSDRLMSYTAMGDAINTASRLESSCSQLKRDVLMAKSTYEEVKDKVIAINAGTISVKGKDEQIEIYEPISFVEVSAQAPDSEQVGEEENVN